MDSYIISFDGLGINDLQINRTAINLFGFSIYWYAIFITVGLVLAVIYAFTSKKRYSITSDNIYDGLLIGMPLAIVFARLYYVVFDMKSFDSIWDIINIRSGGLAIYGAVIGIAIAGIITYRLKKYDVFNMLDLITVPLLIGQAVGRWGNFFNAEIFGRTTSFFTRMTITQNRQFPSIIAKNVHPLFLYESIWNIIGAILLHIFSIKSKKRFKGQIALMYVVWYGVGRGVLESFRDNEFVLKMFNIPVSQVLAFLSAIVAVSVIIYFKKVKKISRFYDIIEESTEQIEIIEDTENIIIKDDENENS